MHKRSWTNKKKQKWLADGWTDRLSDWIGLTYWRTGKIIDPIAFCPWGITTAIRLHTFFFKKNPRTFNLLYSFWVHSWKVFVTTGLNNYCYISLIVLFGIHASTYSVVFFLWHASLLTFANVLNCLLEW